MNNLDKHPFYSKDSFFSDNDYRKWIENEKQRISSLVKPQHIKPKQGLKDRFRFCFFLLSSSFFFFFFFFFLLFFEEIKYK